MGIRYFSVTAPAPWNKSGKATITVRIGGAYPVYLCVGNQRIPLNESEAWGLRVALGNALPATFGPAPAWATGQSTLSDPGQGQAVFDAAPGTDWDTRFTAGLLADVRAVLESHGYRLPTGEQARHRALGGMLSALLALTEVFQGREQGAGSQG